MCKNTNVVDLLYIIMVISEDEVIVVSHRVKRNRNQHGRTSVDRKNWFLKFEKERGRNSAPFIVEVYRNSVR